MEKTEFLTIFRTFERLEIVTQTLPGIIEETKRNDARLIVHDYSVSGRDEKWSYLLDMNRNNDFFLILSSNMSAAHVCNMCLSLGQELYLPEYICMIEDDHGYEQGIIPELIQAMNTYYGKISPNGLRFGLFTGCSLHNTKQRQLLPDGNAFPSADNTPAQFGRANACFRCAPVSHWNTVLKGFDTDEYLVSNYQVKMLNQRNYFHGFTSMIVKNGQFCSYVHSQGRGTSDALGLKRWDENYTASDIRSNFKREQE